MIARAPMGAVIATQTVFGVTFNSMFGEDISMRLIVSLHVPVEDTVGTKEGINRLERPMRCLRINCSVVSFFLRAGFRGQQWKGCLHRKTTGIHKRFNPANKK